MHFVCQQKFCISTVVPRELENHAYAIFFGRGRGEGDRTNKCIMGNVNVEVATLFFFNHFYSQV